MPHLAALFALVVSAAPTLAHADPPDDRYQAGVAKVVITPKQLMWMSGYGARTKPAEGILHDLWAKALVLQDPDGKKNVLVTMDLVGIPRELSASVCKQITAKYGIARERIILSTSHTHTGPVVAGNLSTMYDLDAKQQQYVKEYAAALEQHLVAVVGTALKDLAPAQLSWGQGTAGFAVNRRNNKEADVPTLKAEGKLKGPVDHDVPVLAVRDAKGKLRAIVFGYACHATVLNFYKWSGDYPGFAQLYLEKAHPGAVALFWAGCGSDQNPLPRRTVALADQYGKELADAALAVLAKKMASLAGPIQALYQEIDLPFADLPSREKLVEDSLSKDGFVARRAKKLLQELDKKGSLKGVYPYPVQSWKLGDGPYWVILGGEVVVDYALRLKKELTPAKAWVMAYANDVMAYIPSLRVLKEGGYEGGGAMVYYGLPAVWGPKIEELIVGTVHQQADKILQATPK
jgi:hypothetical protein